MKAANNELKTSQYIIACFSKRDVYLLIKTAKYVN